MVTMIKTPLFLLEVVAILAWLCAVLLGVFTLIYTMPTFTALQQHGIQKTVRVAEKVPYRFGCTGRTCKNYLLKISFFSGVDGTQTWDLGSVKINMPKINLGQLILTQVEVSQAIYEKTNPEDKIRIVYLEENPKEVWLADTALRWTPWLNLSVVIGLAALGTMLLFWNQKQRKKALSKIETGGSP